MLIPHGADRLRARPRPLSALVRLAWLALALPIGLAGPESSAQDFEDVKIQSTSLGHGLHMLTGRGGNMLLSIGTDGVFLVDDQYAPLTPRIQAAISALRGGPVRFVVNTHWHGDHTGGNDNLAGKGALIVAHENVRVRMSSEQFIAALDRRVPPSPERALPLITFDHSVTLHLNGETIRVVHLAPAHTDGDSIVHLPEADVIHTGDLYFAGMYPFFDLSSGGSLDGLVRAADRILEIAGKDTKIVPGHGKLSDRAGLADFREMLVDVRGKVRAALTAGQDTEQIVAARPTRAWDARYGGGFVGPDRFVALVVEGVRAER